MKIKLKALPKSAPPDEWPSRAAKEVIRRLRWRDDFMYEPFCFVRDHIENLCSAAYGEARKGSLCAAAEYSGRNYKIEVRVASFDRWTVHVYKILA